MLVGDIIQINTGDRIPADCVLISGNQLACDESNLTGEPMHILKTPVDSLEQPGLKTDCFLFGGASVMQGTGIAVVCAVGPNSMQGKL